ncbi:hypothetical protein BS50DRAFT_342152 [Corynespora cassiicola Philippines]|uniref:Uncharacterized protein n=1 Tax=Corynespora cassiicola Philippines TaxID=1448308 RepID=A0A2T2NW03_CORCC|nr:hypothetical protein BS50DRAFT_342152 [Corynespora cassiicola Philippines]
MGIGSWVRWSTSLLGVSKKGRTKYGGEFWQAKKEVWGVFDKRLSVGQGARRALYLLPRRRLGAVVVETDASSTDTRPPPEPVRWLLYGTGAGLPSRLCSAAVVDSSRLVSSPLRSWASNLHVLLAAPLTAHPAHPLRRLRRRPKRSRRLCKTTHLAAYFKHHTAIITPFTSLACRATVAPNYCRRRPRSRYVSPFTIRRMQLQ